MTTPAGAPRLPRNNYTPPNIYDTDSRISREFRMTERLRLALNLVSLGATSQATVII